MAIWPTARQQPRQQICQQLLLELTTKATNLSTAIAGVDNQLQDLACWSVHAKPALAVVDQLQMISCISDCMLLAYSHFSSDFAASAS
jgi:hypothetical protein